MSRIIKRTWLVVSAAMTASLVMAGSASAHVVVRPAEVKTASFTTFTIGVPVEKAIPTTSVKLLVPEGLQYVSPTLKANWTVNTGKTGEGEAAIITSITWSGNSIPAGFRDEFSFSAKVPGNAAELQWKAYQTYADGTVVAWDQAENSQQEGTNSGPFSVTKVVTETEAEVQARRTAQAAADADEAADRALYVGIAAAVLGIAGIGLALRKN
ncbi:MAG: DUF1775 domain-containing protein [Candidatus Saccharimonadales bacterium]